MADHPVLRVEDMKIAISCRNRHVVPVSEVGFEIGAGTKLAVVGEIRIRENDDRFGHHWPATGRGKRVAGADLAGRHRKSAL